MNWPDWLTQQRADAEGVVERLGLAPKGDEDWLYASPKDLLPEASLVDEDKIRQLAATHSLHDAGQVLVFAGGVFRPDLSRLAPASPGVAVSHLAAALESHPSDVAAALGRCDAPDSILLALNRQRWTDGLFLHVASGQELSGVVQILEIGSGTSWLRHVVALGEGATASLVETHVSPETGTTSSHTVTEARLPKGAKLTHVRLKAHASGGHHYGALVARLDARSRLETRLFAFGGKIAREEIQVSLDGPEAFALMHGLVKTRGDEKADISLKLRHVSPDCQSEQLFKALADGKSQANFHGTVYVERDAQRTAARQSNKNLLLSRDASVNSRPQLEILADDVKCSHGSATGRLDEKALQFLRCRGLSPESARKLLVHAFAGEMLLPLSDGALRARIDALLGGG